MLVYPKIDPVAFSVGPVKFHWYGLMYVLSFLFFIYAGKWRIRRFGHQFLTEKLLDDFLLSGILGTVLGGRLGYCLFYQPSYYLSHPLQILATWDGGMSFHGGMLGVFVAIYWFARRLNCSFFVISDFVAPLIPICLLFGRLGNFINGELWGRICSANLPWGMVFPASGTLLPRHPSQLYEAGLEGIVLFVVLLIYTRRERKLGQVSGMFMLGYGIARFILEFFREPDAFATEVVNATGLSLGQYYSLPMIAAGIIILWYGSNSKSKYFHTS
jgi:phosphatidylglycerol:prolipoprotein diacylglycerol transferase